MAATKVWIVNDDGPYEHEVGPGLSVVGVFATRDRAFDYLRNDVIGADEFDAIWWCQSKNNPEYFEGWRKDRWGGWVGPWHVYADDVDGDTAERDNPPIRFHAALPWEGAEG